MHFRFDFQKKPVVDDFNRKISHYISTVKDMFIDLYFDKYKINVYVDYDDCQRTWVATYVFYEKNENDYYELISPKVHRTTKGLSVIKQLCEKYDNFSQKFIVDYDFPEECAEQIVKLSVIFSKLGELSHYV